MCPAALWTAALCLLWCALLTPDADAKVTAVWIDVEDHDVIISGRNSTRDRGWLENATSIAHAAGLRFAADAQVGWALSGNSADPTRPVHEQVMDIVDEITLMDYFTACANVSSAVRVVTFSFLCPLFEKYGTFIERCNALIEKVSSFRARFAAIRRRPYILLLLGSRTGIFCPQLAIEAFCSTSGLLSVPITAECRLNWSWKRFWRNSAPFLKERREDHRSAISPCLRTAGTEK
eukprot:SAG31_NODE_1755_length_7344_cov_7.207039_6_plen_235_part_00